MSLGTLIDQAGARFYLKILQLIESEPVARFLRHRGTIKLDLIEVVFNSLFDPEYKILELIPSDAESITSEIAKGLIFSIFVCMSFQESLEKEKLGLILKNWKKRSLKLFHRQLVKYLIKFKMHDQAASFYITLLSKFSSNGKDRVNFYARWEILFGLYTNFSHLIIKLKKII